MSVSLPLSGNTDSATAAVGRRLLIDPGCLVLSSEGYSNADGLQEPLYGVPCLLHNDGAVGTVLVSSLTYGHEVYTKDEDIPKEIQQRMRALWQHPHRCITPPLGLSACQTSSGLNCMLFVEQLRSTSSLQSMILSQMQSPASTLYSTKQALDWLVQLASALAHLHALAPEMPHGRLSSSAIAVTSAADISLGRCVTANAATCDSSPSSKRVHCMTSSSLPPLEPFGEALVPQAFRPQRTNSQEWHSFSSLPMRRTSAGISAAFSPSPELSLPGQRLSLSEASELSGGSQGDGQGADHTQHSTPVSQPWGSSESGGVWDPCMSASMQRLSLSDTRDGPKLGGVGVSRAQVPRVGTVFKVSMPSSGTAQSSRSSLHDAAEAAVWARTESGSETKQHGGALFARAKLGAEGQSRSAPLLKQDSCSSSAEGASPVTDCTFPSSVSGPAGRLDAADTVHVLLQSQMMWDPSSHPGAAPLPQSVGRRIDATASVSQMPPGTSPGGSSFTRVVPRQAVETSLVLPFRDVQRASEDGASPVCRSPGASNPAKRTRSGLSQRLPSLVELPGAEARCALQDGDVELDCASARDSLDGTIQAHTSLTLPSRGATPASECTAVRPVPGGLSGFSSSAGNGSGRLNGDGAGAGGEGVRQPGLMISTALARLQYAAPALARVRTTVLRAATGQPKADAQQRGQPRRERHSESDVAAAGASSGRTSEEQKQRGSLSVMQLLQTSKDNDRERWRARLLNRKTSCSALLRGSNGAIATHIGRWHDDLPYLAPEMLEGGEASPAADCFAFGVIMYEVIKRELVAADIAMQADLNDLADEDALRWHVARIVDGERPRVPVSWPAEVKEVIQLCWQDNPFDRPTLASVHASLVHYQATNPQ